jgi:hypothetical protein
MAKRKKYIDPDLYRKNNKTKTRTSGKKWCAQLFTCSNQTRVKELHLDSMYALHVLNRKYVCVFCLLVSIEHGILVLGKQKVATKRSDTTCIT